MPCRSQADSKVLDDAIAVRGRRVDGHEIVVVEIDAPRANFCEQRNRIGWRERRPDDVAERIAAAIADRPEAERELVLGARSELIGHMVLLRS